MTRIGARLAGCWLAVAIPTCAQAQVGIVFDRMSGAPISGAAVGWSPAAEAEPVQWVDTDLRGRFAVPERWAGSGTLEIRSLGHRTLRMAIGEVTAAAWRIGLEPDPLELESVVVTAAGRVQRRAEVAVPLVTVSSHEIDASGAPSAQALLAEIPGLQAVGVAPVGSNIMIRGIGDSRVLVLLDGQPAGGALLENRDLSRMSLAGVERVEVVKGPLSSRYGSDALGGVINVITREPEAGLDLDARFLAGGAGRREADATLAGGGDALRFRATGSWRQEDQVPGLDRSLDVFSRVWDLRTSTRYDGRRIRLRGDVSLVRERQRWPVGGGFSGFNDNRGISGWVEAGIGAGPGDLTVRALGQDYHHLYRSARGSAPIAGTDDLQKEQLWEGALGYRLAVGAHEIDIGLEGATRSIESPDKLLEDKASDSQLELFGQDAWGLGRTTVTAGARLTVNDRWGNTASPTVGFSSLLGEAIRVFGTVGRGFRAPSFKELAWDFANVGAGYTVQGFAELGPERSWSASGGLEWAPGSSVLITGEAYHNEIDDLIEFAFVGNTPSGLLVYSPRNVERARTRGLELTAEARLGAARVSGDYAFLDAKSLDDGLPLDRRARHSGRVRIAGEVPLLEGTQVDLTAHVTGDAPLVGLDDEGQPATIGTQEALMALDAQIAIRVPGDLSLVLGADNLLDSRPTGWQAVVGRRFRVGIEARNLF